MKSNTTPTPLSPPKAEQATQSANWSEREHVSEQSQVAAQSLVDAAGSPEHAKHAIDVVEKSQSASPADHSTQVSPTIIKRNDHFVKALEDLETSLETPLISGDLTDWVTTVQRACEHLDVLLRGDVQREHAALYVTISQEDPELARRVEKLRATDEQSLVDFGNVQLSLKKLLDRAQLDEQDEAKAKLLSTEVVKQALAFVISARTQETVIATWFSESFNRDSGFGD
ncbi:MAG TPA: hypothetical protein P5307_13100 [Pirellulaceae bacterium]|nr:hypothetical protein [Pirellulaceae bacterium]